MIRIYALVLSLTGAFGFLTAQTPGYWTDITPAQVFLPEGVEPDLLPEEYRLLQLDLEGLKNELRRAPLEGSPAAERPLRVWLPLPDGTLEPFDIVESPVMKPALQAKYPMIRSFAGRAVNRPYLRTRFDYGLEGFNASIIGGEEAVLITPYAPNQTTYYMAFEVDKMSFEGLNLPPVLRGYDASIYDPDQTRMEGLDPSKELRFGSGERGVTPVVLRVYDFALATTGEFANLHGGTLQSVLSAVNTATNVLNSVLENDAAIRVVLVDNIENILFLDPNTDPYVNSNQGGALLGQNGQVLAQFIGQDNYDWGHVFTASCTDVGGVVGGAICAQSKGAGVTCHFSNNVAWYTMQIGAHEMAHQLTGGHTFSFCPGSEGQMSLATAWEPGSGSTLLSYSGSCGSQNNIQTTSDPYYHGGNIEQFMIYTRLGNGSTCATLQETPNHEPELELPYGFGFYIPISTPFELIAQAGDPDGDQITYCWEQLNVGSAPLGQPHLESPLFRSYPPTTAPNRVLPRMQTIVNNQVDVKELLPDYGRNITFRCTVRDNYPGAGGVVFKDVSFEVDPNAGPFLVLHPNADTIRWTSGQWTEVTWDVANTDNNRVDCRSVNIRLSTDGGFNYPYTLLGGTPNDGSEFVFVPDFADTIRKARVRVEAADNIFFDISNANFEIVPAEQPGFIARPEVQYQQICAPDIAQVKILTDAIAGFDTTLTFSITSALPQGITATFSKDSLQPGDFTLLDLDMSTVQTDLELEVEVLATAPGADTVRFSLFFDIIFSDFSQLELLAPVNGASGLNLLPTFEWSPLDNAESYDFQLASNPSFAPEFIIDEISGIKQASFTPTVGLNENTLYFWRVRARNACLESEWSSPFGFHTFVVQCSSFESNDGPINIPGTGLPLRKSEITIVQSGQIEDLNIVNVKGVHDAVPDLEVRVVSPEGTSAVLMSADCGNTSIFHVGFDDEAPFEIQCPPLGGIAYKPKEPLSIFDGESTLGTWTLEVEVINTLGTGGYLEGWGVEFCAGFEPNPPFLVNNNVLRVPPNDSRQINSGNLLAEDPDNSSEELIFTIARAPKHGDLLVWGEKMAAGDKFKQIDINSGGVRYLNTNPDAETDDFGFTVQDGTGGWFGVETFNIIIDPEAPVATTERELDAALRFFPNPTTGELHLATDLALEGEVRLSISDLQGRRLLEETLPRWSGTHTLTLEGLSGGLYLLRLETADAAVTRKVILQR